jgi:PAS domain S-box-containing protein
MPASEGGEQAMSDDDLRLDSRAIYRQLLAEQARCVVYRYRLAPARGFEYVSPSATWLTGYSPEEHYADPDLAYKLVHPDDHHTLQQMLEAHLTDRAMLRFIRKDGRMSWMELCNLGLCDNASQLTSLAAIAHDITGQQQAEEALAADTRFLRLQAEVAEVALSSLELDVLGPRLLEVIAQAQGYAYGALWHLARNRKEAVVVATVGDQTAAYLGFRLKLSEPLPVVAQVIRTGQPIFCNQIQKTPLAKHPLYQILQPQALLALPLIQRRHDVVGALSFGDADNPERFTERDLVRGVILARQVAQALENSDLFAQLQHLEARYRVVTGSINDALYTTDRDGRVRFGNAALERLTGYGMQESLGRHADLFYTSGSRIILRQHRKRTRREESVRPRVEIEVLRKDGRRVPVELSRANLVQQGKIVGHVGVLRDITERKRATEEAGQRRREAEVLAELARTLNASLDPEEVGRRIVESVCGLFGTASAALLRLEVATGDFTALAQSGDVDCVIGTHIRLGKIGVIGLAVRKRQPVAAADYLGDRRAAPRLARGSLPEGRPHRSVLAIPLIHQECVIGALAILDRPGRVFTQEEIRLAQAFADQAATALENAHLYQELQRAYDKLSHTQDQLIFAQKMEAVGRLAGGIAHDFNNLLTVIMGRADLVLSRLRGRDRLRRDLELILSASDSAASLTRQLLAFSRRQVLLPGVIDLNTVVVNVSTMLRWLIGEDIEVIIRLAPGLGPIKADPGQLEQVLMNLAVNARDAMPQGGQLTIETANVSLDKAYAQTHLGVKAGRYVRLRVQDSGCGMDDETQAHMFEPFFTTKELGKGTGLGLSTVYGIITQSGGHISVISAPGQGTGFTIDLPRIEDSPAILTAAVPQAAAPQGTETVLLVEDEGTVRSVAREVLQMVGYTVLEAATGEEALQQSTLHDSPIHLLVTDVVMPGMSGRELAERLTIDYPALGVLYLSGYTDEAIAHHGVLEAGIELLHKPFTPDALARRVREVLDKGMLQEPMHPWPWDIPPESSASDVSYTPP